MPVQDVLASSQMTLFTESQSSTSVSPFSLRQTHMSFSWNCLAMRTSVVLKYASDFLYFTPYKKRLGSLNCGIKWASMLAPHCPHFPAVERVLATGHLCTARGWVLCTLPPSLCYKWRLHRSSLLCTFSALSGLELYTHLLPGWNLTCLWTLTILIWYSILQHSLTT